MVPMMTNNQQHVIDHVQALTEKRKKIEDARASKKQFWKFWYICANGCKHYWERGDNEFPKKFSEKFIDITLKRNAYEGKMSCISCNHFSYGYFTCVHPEKEALERTDYHDDHVIHSIKKRLNYNKKKRMERMKQRKEIVTPEDVTRILDDIINNT